MFIMTIIIVIVSSSSLEFIHIFVAPVIILFIITVI